MSRLHATDANADLDFFERERADMLVYLDHLRANPAYLRLAGEIELHEPRLYRRAVADGLARVAARIRAGIARGDLRPMNDVEITAQAYFMLGGLPPRAGRTASSSADRWISFPSEEDPSRKSA